MKLGNEVHITQKKELVEVFTDFETKNRYAVLDKNGQAIGYAAEESNTLARFLLKAARPLNLHITDSKGNEQMVVDKKFAVMFPRFEIRDSDGRVMARAKVIFALMKKYLSIYDTRGNEVLTCVAKLPHPWTFSVTRGGKEVAQISKKWSGFGKEAFTEADTFHVDFKNVKDAFWKNVLLGIGFAIDLIWFEKSG